MPAAGRARVDPRPPVSRDRGSSVGVCDDPLAEHLHLFDPGIVWDNFGAILATLVLFALIFCLFLYWKGRHWPTSEDRSISGNFIWDSERGGMLLPAQEVLHNLRPLVIAAWIAVAWIGLDSWLSIAVWRRELRRAHEAGTEAASALSAKAARE